MALQHLQLEVPDQHSGYATALQAMDGGIMPRAYEVRFIWTDESRTLRWCKFVG